MKTSPEDRDVEELLEGRSPVSKDYRAASRDEPPAHLDAAILAAARRGVEPQTPQTKRNWHMPASIAAVLVIGVSLALMTQKIEEPLPPLAESDRYAPRVATPAAPNLARQAQPKVHSVPQLAIEREARPSRERSSRIDRLAGMRQDAAPAAELADAGAGQTALPPVVAAPAPPAALKRFEQTAPADGAEEKKKALAGSVEEARDAPKSLRKEAAASAVAVRTPDEWLKEIEDLLRAGRRGEARARLTEFRLRYPDYRLPERLSALEAEAK